MNVRKWNKFQCASCCRELRGNIPNREQYQNYYFIWSLEIIISFICFNLGTFIHVWNAENIVEGVYKRITNKTHSVKRLTPFRFKRSKYNHYCQKNTTTTTTTTTKKIQSKDRQKTKQNKTRQHKQTNKQRTKNKQKANTKPKTKQKQKTKNKTKQKNKRKCSFLGSDAGS